MSITQDIIDAPIHSERNNSDKDDVDATENLFRFLDLLIEIDLSHKKDEK